MKRYAPIVLILAVVAISAAFATDPSNISSRWLGLFFTDSSTGAARAVTDADPLQVTVTSGSTSGSSAGTTIAPASSAWNLPWSVGPTAASWTTSASSTDIGVWHTGSVTVWLSYNSGGATVGVGIPLVASGFHGRDLGPGNTVWGICSVTQNITKGGGNK